ncbi:hypothetical protein RHGRI_008721 [Rhododendron griersonianum]|uniref:ABIL2 n=1 Tax=Rhododendron griersonianum TaxID=479676 RepID=A0AAV6L1C5_9ERIC|nr:hypothetical protein RHGRI_008721 [Rhododendron griersonianum]
METMVSSVSLPIHREPANYDEVSMQQSLLFSDSLKDLKNLRSQLYSAAEYFELSYTNDDQKHIVVDTLKEYAIKALVNTVDHLGSVTYKVNDLLDEKVDEVSGTELRVSCIEQVFPYFFIIMQCVIQRKEPSPSPTSRHLQQSGTFLFTSSTPNKELEKRTVSPHRFPLLRSGSLARSGSPASCPTTPNSRATTPNSSRPTTPNALVARPRFPSEPRKSASMRIRPEKGKENSKEIELFPSKSKRLLKALLSRRKSKKDEMLYTYLDEY